MSLDVYLSVPGEKRKYEARIFVREDGQTKEISRDEWNERYPDREPVVMEEIETDYLYSQNITHNLGKMAEKAGIYKHLWRPEEIGITKASDLIVPLRQGLEILEREPERFTKFNPKNGWGSYEGLVSFVQSYLTACIENPHADVSVSR